jgi:uncharacterized RDD family membrane protein YckC
MNVAVSADKPAGLAVRLAVMTYEAVLLFGVVFIPSYLLLALMQWQGVLEGGQRWAHQAVLFIAIGVYFVWCWHRSGQTLAMKTWNLRLVLGDGGRVSLSRAIARYVLAWHLFVPGLAAIALLQDTGPRGAVWLLVSFVLMLLPAVFDQQRRLLHDHVLGTRVIKDPG